MAEKTSTGKGQNKAAKEEKATTSKQASAKDTKTEETKAVKGAKDDKKTKSGKKPNIFVRMGKGIARFFRDTKGEMKKVVWPSAKQVRNNFFVVILFCFLVALLVFGLDTLFGWLLGLVVNIDFGAAEEAVSSFSVGLGDETLASLFLPFLTIL